MFKTEFSSAAVRLRKQLVIQCLLGILLFTSFSSCRKSNPLTSEEITPGRRDYFWHVDTLNMPMNFLYSVWGSSPEDVWAVGAGGDFDDRLQHFDGNKWTAYKKEMITCSGNTLFGFSPNDVWMGGGDGEIWHFDGSKWGRNYKYEVDGAVLVFIKSIHGTNSNDVYASGTIFYKGSAFEPDSHKGFVLHYDGYTWTEVCKGNFNSQFLQIRKEKDKIYVYSLTFDQFNGDNDIITYYELNGSMLKKIYSNTRGNMNMGCMSTIGSKVYFLEGKNICSYFNGKPLSLLSVTNENFGNGFTGRSESDIFIRMNDGLAHYNGKDILYLCYPPQNAILANEPMIFEKDVFNCLFDPTSGKNMMLHGKLINK